MNNNINKNILQDIDKNNKERPWREKKVKSILVEESFVRIKEISRAERVNQCGTLLTFNECDQGHKRLKTANFCRDRLCPMCNWRRSRMLQSQIMDILRYARERKRMRFLFLTLTIKNVKSDELEEAITTMLSGFNRLKQLKAFDKHTIGWIRNLEITYNDKDDTYHPHFHVLMAVNPRYFVDGYISQNTMTELWQKVCKLDYTPIINIKAVKSLKDDKNIEKAVLETAKYSVKDTDYIKEKTEDTDRIIKTLMQALKGRHLIGFGKYFKEVRKELKLKDIESDEADLVDAKETVCTCPICNNQLTEQSYKWNYSISQYIKCQNNTDQTIKK